MAKQYGLLIKWALDRNNLIKTPDTAERGEHYRCPLCKESVIFRKGKIRVPHFAHKKNVQCTLERIRKIVAQYKMVEVFSDWKNSTGEKPQFLRRCGICQKWSFQNLSDKVDAIDSDFPLSDGASADLVLKSKDIPVALIFIDFNPNPSKLKNLPINLPYIVVDPNEIVKNPYIWQPINDHFNKNICTSCIKTKSILAKQTYGIELKKNNFQFRTIRCWNCNHTILVFLWPIRQKEGLAASQNCISRPSTLVEKYSDFTGSSYLANTCPHCHSVQIEHYQQEPREFNF
ncbi:competence protein [Sphaerochaeta pleomorpha str. Grapes]|uniref:Competence protein n=1 Tax=Sphaerochaeta pleomorpha (strain ATCC BAA-1885 / DSM 22778 / Grapes) TaxID=158190 RepID=G8QQQ1_SPHPG|nr:competence protein CoiA family protein [Sphaerochaeta pleomorpha]AEV28682.1 competence protein [Sphaerochaeta pleomorpha str. Grapes]